MAILKRSPGVNAQPIREIYGDEKQVYLRIARWAAQRRSAAKWARRAAVRIGRPAPAIPATPASRRLTVAQVRRMVARGKAIRLKLHFANQPAIPKQQPPAGRLAPPQRVARVMLKKGRG